MSRVGVQLKQLRARRDVGVRELAIRSGVSHSTISLIERDKISPSVDTLTAILDALGTTLVGFFSELQASTVSSPFYPAPELVEIGHATRVSYRMIGVNHPQRQMLMLHETYAPNAETGVALTHSAQEAGMVIKGAIEVTVGEEKRILRPGDGYYFDSRKPHTFKNVANETSEIVSAVTPPTY